MVANSGHFNVEINIDALERLAISKKRLREGVDEFTLTEGRRIRLLREGRLINLAGAEGHPPEVMDMSFANQALCVEYLTGGRSSLQAGVHTVPSDIDNWVARLKLDASGLQIDKLTTAQTEYLSSWESGT